MYTWTYIYTNNVIVFCLHVIVVVGIPVSDRSIYHLEFGVKLSAKLRVLDESYVYLTDATLA